MVAIKAPRGPLPSTHCTTPALSLLLSQRDAPTTTAQPRLITLSITKAYTTYTTIIQLGDSNSNSNSPSSDLAPQSSSSPSSQSPASNPVPLPSDTTPSGVLIGAILGSVLGFIAICVLVWYCWLRGRVFWRYDSDSESSSGSGSGSGSGSEEMSERPRMVRILEVKRVRRVRRSGTLNDN